MLSWISAGSSGLAGTSTTRSSGALGVSVGQSTHARPLAIEGRDRGGEQREDPHPRRGDAGRSRARLGAADVALHRGDLVAGPRLRLADDLDRDLADPHATDHLTLRRDPIGEQLVHQLLQAFFRKLDALGEGAHEVAPHVRRRFVAPVGRAGEGAQTDPIECARDAVEHLRGRRDLVRQHRLDRRTWVAALEETARGQQLVEDDPQREHIRALVERVVLDFARATCTRTCP